MQFPKFVVQFDFGEELQYVVSENKTAIRNARISERQNHARNMDEHGCSQSQSVEQCERTPRFVESDRIRRHGQFQLRCQLFIDDRHLTSGVEHRSDSLHAADGREFDLFVFDAERYVVIRVGIRYTHTGPLGFQPEKDGIGLESSPRPLVHIVPALRKQARTNIVGSFEVSEFRQIVGHHPEQ